MKLLILSRYSSLGPSSRVRIYQYLPHLKREGFEITVAPLFDDDYIRALHGGRAITLPSLTARFFSRLRTLLGARSFDLLWIEYETLPWLPSWPERILARAGVPYLVEYDDAIFHRYDQHRMTIVRSLLGRKIDRIMEAASVVLTCNEYLADRARKAGARRIETLPTVVDLDRYPKVEPRVSPVPRIGWIGTATTEPYVTSIAPALRKVCREGRATLTVIGGKELAIEGVSLERRAWSEETEVRDLQTIDIGIMPLPDTPWERGKCGYKLIQYMACSKPVVASPVGVNGTIVERGVNGFLAASHDEWVSALRQLIDDAELRKRYGAKGREKIEREYSLQATAPRLTQILRDAV